MALKALKSVQKPNAVLLMAFMMKEEFWIFWPNTFKKNTFLWQLCPTLINVKYRTIIQNSTAKQMERLFNALPYELQNLTNVETDTFKKHLDDWLRTIPDTPKIDSYGASVPAASNSIVDQCMTKWWPYMWVTRSPNQETEY